MTASVRTVTYLCLYILRISFEGCKGMWLLEQAGGRGLVRSVSHIEGCKRMRLFEQAGGRGLVRSVLHIEGCKGMWLLEQAGGRGLVRSVSHIEGCKGMWLLEQAGGRGLVRSVLYIEAWRAGAGVDTIEEDDAVCMYTQWCSHRGGLNRNIGLPSSMSAGCSTHGE